MNKFLEKVTSFTQTRYMQIIMNGFMGVTAITIAGSLFTLIKSLPFGPWLTFLQSSGVGDLLSLPVLVTTDAIALYIAFSMANQTAKSFGKDGFAAALISVGSFLLLTPFQTEVLVDEVPTMVDGVIPLSAIGAQGIFLAIIVGILSARFYVFLIDSGFKITMPDSVPPNVTKMFESLIPGGITFLLFLGIRYGMAQTPFGTAQNLIYGILQYPLTAVGGGVAGVVVFLIAANLLWIFGIHGAMVAYIGMSPIIQLMMAENLGAFAQGIPAPHPEWAIFMFVMLGGSGATLALNLLMVSPIAKSEQYKTLGKIALPTSIFNINEPIIFGTPVILNPFLAIPFVITPLINLAIALIAMRIGFFVPTGASINNFMPFGVFGTLLSGSWSGLAISIILLVVDIFIWLPFFKYSDNVLYNQEREAQTVEV